MKFDPSCSASSALSAPSNLPPTTHRSPRSLSHYPPFRFSPSFLCSFFFISISNFSSFAPFAPCLIKHHTHFFLAPLLPSIFSLFHPCRCSFPYPLHPVAICPSPLPPYSSPLGTTLLPAIPQFMPFPTPSLSLPLAPCLPFAPCSLHPRPPFPLLPPPHPAFA